MLLKSIALFVAVVSGGMAFSQTGSCDTLHAKVSSGQAKKIVFEKQYGSYSFQEIEFVQLDSLCCWKVVVADRYSVKHHGHYARTYRTYWIHSQTGEIVKQEGVKKIEGYYQE